MNDRAFDLGHFIMGLVFIGIGTAFLLDRLDVWTPRLDVLGALVNRSRA
jgi:hypothetical protein